MKVSAWVSVADLVLVRKTFLERAIHLLLKGEKSNMFATVSLKEIFPTLKKSGVDGLELLVQFHTSDQNIQEVKKIVEHYEIPVLSIHQSLDSFGNVSLEEIERLCEIANIFSSKVIVLHSNALKN